MILELWLQGVRLVVSRSGTHITASPSGKTRCSAEELAIISLFENSNNSILSFKRRNRCQFFDMELDTSPLLRRQWSTSSCSLARDLRLLKKYWTHTMATHCTRLYFLLTGTNSLSEYSQNILQAFGRSMFTSSQILHPLCSLPSRASRHTYTACFFKHSTRCDILPGKHNCP